MIDDDYDKFGFLPRLQEGAAAPSIHLEMEDGQWYLFCDGRLTQEQPDQVTHVTSRKGTTVTLSFDCDFDYEKPKKKKKPLVKLTEVY